MKYQLDSCHISEFVRKRVKAEFNPDFDDLRGEPRKARDNEGGKKNVIYRLIPSRGKGCWCVDVWRGVGEAILGEEWWDGEHPVSALGVGSAEDTGEMGVNGLVGEACRNSVISSCIDIGSSVVVLWSILLKSSSAMLRC